MVPIVGVSYMGIVVGNLMYSKSGILKQSVCRKAAMFNDPTQR
jgi:hypothetical protein